MALDALRAAGLDPAGPAFWILMAALIVAIGLLAGLVAFARRASRLASQFAAARDRAAGLAARNEALESLRAELDVERSERRRIEADLAAVTARAAEREAGFLDLKKQIYAEFNAAAAGSVEAAHQAFLGRANEIFQLQKEAVGADAQTRIKAIDELVKPMSEALQRYEAGLAELRTSHAKDRGELLSRIGDLARISHETRVETQKLTTALRSGAKVRGRWGEEQLRNVVELAGMSAHVDFVEQRSITDGERRLQPDMIVNLPGGRKIAIDSKVSLGAYLDALEAEDETARAAAFARHADDLWTHVKTLSGKDYAASIRDALDIVVMFVPGENYFAAAMDARPQLFQDAFARRVLVATPTTLLAMLKSASYVWRQEKLAEGAIRAAALARDLHDSLKKMSEHVGSVGKSLGKAVESYNAAVGNFETRVLPRARRFAEFQLPGVEGEIAGLQAVDATPRPLRDDRIGEAVRAGDSDEESARSPAA
jgi:DNA recombination protein RmuC